MNQCKRLVTVKNLPSKYPDANLTESSVRWLIFNAKENGFSACVVRIGRKVLIDLEIFEQWLDEQAVKGGTDMFNIKFPERKSSLCARTLARLINGEHLKHRDADSVSGSYRLSGYIHYLQTKYGFPIERTDSVSDTGDPVGRSAPYTEYWLSDVLLKWIGQAGLDWAREVLALEAVRIAEREAATSHPAEKKGLRANSLCDDDSRGDGGAHGSK